MTICLRWKRFNNVSSMKMLYISSVPYLPLCDLHIKTWGNFLKGWNNNKLILSTLTDGGESSFKKQVWSNYSLWGNINFYSIILQIQQTKAIRILSINIYLLIAMSYLIAIHSFLSHDKFVHLVQMGRFPK